MPSYNQASFLEEAIRSVLLQNYPKLEFILLDGGSTDGSTEIIRRYAPWIDICRIGPDGGQTKALNKGFDAAKGVIVGWQNSDDFYLPGALWACAAAAIGNTMVGVFHGRTLLFKEETRSSEELFIESFDPALDPHNFPLFGFSNQSMFFHRSTIEGGYRFNEDYRNGMDSELLSRMVLDGIPFQYVPGLRGVYRIHKAARTLSEQSTSATEACMICLSAMRHPKARGRLRRKIVTGLQQHLASLYRSGHHKIFRQIVLGAILDGRWSVLAGKTSLRLLAGLLPKAEQTSPTSRQ